MGENIQYWVLELIPIFGTFTIHLVMGRNTSISLGSHFEEFIEKSIESGRFNNASEMVRAGLRLLEDEEYRVASLRNALMEGVDSGRVEGFDANNHLESLKIKRANNGELPNNK